MIADLYKPYRAAGSIRNEIENLTLRSFGGPINTGPAVGEWLMPAKIDECEEYIYVSAALTGVDIEDISITIERNILTVRGERKNSNGHVLGEKYYGSFSYSIGLGTEVKKDQVRAVFKGDTLEITLPKVLDPAKIKVEKA